MMSNKTITTKMVNQGVQKVLLFEAPYKTRIFYIVIRGTRR